jgi:hypothetical protein
MSTKSIQEISKIVSLRLLSGHQALKLGRLLSWEEYFLSSSRPKSTVIYETLQASEQAFEKAVRHLQGNLLSETSLEESASLLSGADMTIRCNPVSVNFFGKSLPKPKPQILGEYLETVFEKDRLDMGLLEYIKIYRDLNLCHPFLDFNGRVSRAYLTARIGYEDSLTLLYRLKSNKRYGMSNYAHEILNNFDSDFMCFWQDAICWKQQVMKDVQYHIAEGQRAMSEQMLSAHTPPIIAELLKNPFTNPVIEYDGLAFNLDNRYFGIKALTSGRSVLFFKPSINAYNCILTSVYDSSI